MSPTSVRANNGVCLGLILSTAFVGSDVCFPCHETNSGQSVNGLTSNV